MKTRIQKWGNSQGIRFPRHILQKAHISVGDEVEIISRESTIIVKPSREIRGKYDLKNLVADMPDTYRISEEYWGGNTGKEVW